MVRFRPSILLVLVLLSPFARATGDVPTLHHDLTVELDPDRRSLRVIDRLTWSAPPEGPLEFILHGALAPRVEGKGRLSRRGESDDGAIPLERHRLIPEGDGRTVTLRYGGTLHHPLAAHGEGAGQAGETTPGIIDREGVVLGPASGWYPQVVNFPRQTFTLTVTAPAGWEAVSQGRREAVAGGVRWVETTPQEEIYLIAGRFSLYQRGSDPAAMVYLRSQDAALAERYLSATERYLRLYSRLLGSYPYAKFALVENFWETGYGMPSFTLLGPRVIRLPFLIESAYPHEVLHNWWGNGVYVDAAQGNWSEGLTAYLADHLLKEQAGRGSDYRRDQLQAYAAHVSEGRDFPLARFRARHSGATQAVGYGKSMMFFHMVRRAVGDRAFVAGLRRFYRENLFDDARFDTLRRAWEAESGSDLGELFAQWLLREGAPTLSLAHVEFTADGLRLALEQTQSEPPFRLKVPVVIGFGDGRMEERTVEMTERRLSTTLKTARKPLCVAIDPRFDLFRRLLPGEEPAALNRVLGGDRFLVLLPAAAPEPLRGAYRKLAEAWAADQATIEVREDRDFDALPSDRPVMLLGWQNRHLGALPLKRETDAVVLDGRTWPRKDHSFVLTAREPGRALAWLGTDEPVTLAALARKVPHYGKFSYLVFEGAAAENRLKGQWATDASPLTRRVGDASCRPPPEAPLVAGAD